MDSVFAPALRPRNIRVRLIVAGVARALAAAAAIVTVARPPAQIGGGPPAPAPVTSPAAAAPSVAAGAEEAGPTTGPAGHGGEGRQRQSMGQSIEAVQVAPPRPKAATTGKW